MNKLSPIVAHMLVSIIGIIGLVVVNVWGNESVAVYTLLGGAITGGAWGAYQRQKDPVDSSIIAKETERGKI